MTTFLGSPRLQKGAIVGIDPLNPLAIVNVFKSGETRVSTAE